MQVLVCLLCCKFKAIHKGQFVWLYWPWPLIRPSHRKLTKLWTGPWEIWDFDSPLVVRICHTVTHKIRLKTKHDFVAAQTLSEHKCTFRSGKCAKTVWQKISQGMKEQGYQVTWDMCDNPRSRSRSHNRAVPCVSSVSVDTPQQDSTSAVVTDNAIAVSQLVMSPRGVPVLVMLHK